jgi:hypothetical protein
MTRVRLDHRKMVWDHHAWVREVFERIASVAV